MVVVGKKKAGKQKASKKPNLRHNKKPEKKIQSIFYF